MQFQFKINIGGTEITVVETAESKTDFVKKISFFSSLPTEGPNGEKDLVFRHRTTKEGYNYYSIVSEKADQEFKFGQSQQEPGELYGKGWEPLYHPDENAQAGNGGAPIQTGAVVQQTAPVQQAPVTQQVVQTPVQQPVQQQVVQTPVQQPVQQTTQAPVQQQVVQQPAQQVNPQVQNQNQQVANNVLAQFGIKQ